MKISYTIMALLAAGFLGHSAFADDNAPLCLTVTQNGHGASHFLYRQSDQEPYINNQANQMNGQAYSNSVALSTPSGGVDTSMAVADQGQPDNGIKFVIGTNQHGQVSAAYVATTSYFGPARQ